MSNTEVFIPYSDFEDHILVQWLRNDQDYDMVVEYDEEEYKLQWDDRYSYYAGTVNGVKGYIP